MAKSPGKRIQKTFSKEERLTNKSLIEELFKNGSSFYSGPVKVIHLTLDKNLLSHNQVLFTVPKRLYKKAINRNLLKRRMREIYRLNKSILPNTLDQVVIMAYIYVNKEIVSYSELERKLIASIERLEREAFH